jgi:hypothetical protein
MNRRPRENLTFDAVTGAEAQFDIRAATCVLDIHSNILFDMHDYGLHQTSGNYSKWVHLDDNQGVAVTGLASCGAVFLANEDFSRVAAGHMSGDALYAAEWLCKLMAGGHRGTRIPRFILWATGTSGSRSVRFGGHVLLKYMGTFNIPPSRAPAVAGCGAVLLIKSAAGAIVHASRSHEIAGCNRSGQAIKDEYKEPSQEEQILGDFHTKVKNYDGEGIVSQFLLIQSISSLIAYHPPITFTTGKEAQEKALSEHGKNVTNAYYTTLPTYLKPAFLEFAIFKSHPEWRPED